MPKKLSELSATISADSLKSPGQIGYEAYIASTDNKAYDGRLRPRWDQLLHQTQTAWEVAATAILTAGTSSSHESD